MPKYLDENGLSTLWGKITDKVAALKCYDTGASDTKGTWTVTIPGITALTEGLTIKIRLKTLYNGTTNTLNLNGLGAKTIYFRYGNKLTSHYSIESVLALTYTENAISSGNDRSGWIIENIYDSTNTYQLRKYYTRYKTKSALYRYMICFVNKDEELIPANSVSNSTATTKTLTTESFMPSKGIYYYNSTTELAAEKYTGNATLYQQLGLINLQYSFNTGTTLTANKPVYLVVTPQADGQVKLASTPIAQTLPTSDTSNWYVFLGTAYDNYRIELPIEHPIYAYHNGYCESLDHTHYNKTILDNTTASFTTTDKTNLGNVLNVAAANTNKITTLDGNVVKLAGDQTVNGVKTFNAPANSSGTEQTTMKIKTANGGAIIFGKEGPNSGSMIRLDQTDGTTRLQFRASATEGAMVWKQPESGAALYFDFGPNATRTTMPTSGGTLAYTSQIPTALKNPHALTFGTKTYDGSSDQTITASDLGALTSHQSLADYVKKSDLASVAQTVSSNTSKITTLQGYFNNEIANKATADASGNTITTTYATKTELSDTESNLASHLDDKQDTLVSGTNIKTINGNSLLGSGNIAISTSGTVDSALSDTSTNPVQNKVINSALSNKQDKLVSGTNIKSINNTSILSSGNFQLLEPNTSNITTGTTGSWESRFYNSSTGTYRTCRIVYGTVSINKSSFYNQEITFAKSMPSANYSVILSATISNNTASREVYLSIASKGGTTTKKTTSFYCNGHMGNTSYKITYLHYIAIYIS